MGDTAIINFDMTFIIKMLKGLSNHWAITHLI